MKMVAGHSVLQIFLLCFVNLQQKTIVVMRPLLFRPLSPYNFAALRHL